MLLHPPEGSPKTRLNTGDRMGTSLFSHFLAELNWDGRQHTLAPRYGVCTWRDGRSAHRGWCG
jgi:hypothetical protein